MLAYVEANPRDDLDWRPLAQFDPHAVLALTEQLGAGRSTGYGMMELAQRMALTEWVHDDSLAAIRYAEAITEEKRRELVVGAVAGAYARLEPYSAWQWVHELDAPSHNAVLTAVAEIAAREPHLPPAHILLCPSPRRRRAQERSRRRL